jgi:hypothetical protein
MTLGFQCCSLKRQQGSAANRRKSKEGSVSDEGNRIAVVTMTFLPATFVSVSFLVLCVLNIIRLCVADATCYTDDL